MGTAVEEGTAENSAKTKLNAAENPEDDTAIERAADPVRDLSTALQILHAENAELKEKNLRLLADMENVRIRHERDRRECAKKAISEFASELLAIADSIHRTIGATPKELAAAVPAVKGLVEGVEVTERAFHQILGRFQVTRFYPLGEPFNPNLHIAKLRTNAPNVPANTVVQVIQAGYLIGDKVLRPASVIVAQSAAKPATERVSGNQGAHAPFRPAPLPARNGFREEGAAARFGPQATKMPNAPLEAQQQAAKMHHKPAVLHKPIISATEGIPAATHPIWERLVTGQVRYKFKLFAANMLIDRARREYANNRSAKTQLANEICTFFNRYAQVIAGELQPIVAAIGGIPAATHPIWEQLVTGQVRHKFKLFAANMLVDRAKREYANNRAAKPKLVSELCEFFNGHADLTASELEMVASKERIWLN